MTVNCSGCKWWDPIGEGFGYCTLAESKGDEPVMEKTWLMARALDGSMPAQLITFHKVSCNQFSRHEADTENKEAVNAVPEESQIGKPAASV
jgi:hypothetical protein